MKTYLSYITIFTLTLITAACGKLDYENKEFYKQEVYIINSESTSATEREITGVQAYTFVDTLKIINDSYDTDTLVDYKVGTANIIFKIGIGGSLSAHEDLEILIDFDEEAVKDYNISKMPNVIFRIRHCTRQTSLTTRQEKDSLSSLKQEQPPRL